MSFSKTLVKASMALSTLALVATPTLAAGDETKVTEKEVCVTQYGGQTECKKEVITEEVTHDETVTHETVDAGLGENLLVLAAIMGSVAVTAFALSKITQKVYLFD